MRGVFPRLAGPGLAALLVGASLISSCTPKPQSPRDTLLARERVVFMCQHPQGKAVIPDELKIHAREVDVIAPMWYNIQSNGSVELIFPDVDTREFLEFCRQKGIAVMPVLRNFKPRDFLLDPAARDRAVSEIAGLLAKEGYEGFTVDIEEDSSDIRTKAPMLDFLSKVQTACHDRGRMLCVTFNPVYWGRGWQNEEILPLCDWAFAMFYDYSGPWNKNAINATAPYDWPGHARDVKRDVARIMIPGQASKIIFGIPAYGNRVTFDEEGNCVEFTVAYVNDFLAEQKMTGAARIWDEQARSPRFEFQQNGRRTVVWYEDEESYRWRMKLACEREAAGVGVWSIGARGGLDDAIWKVLRSYRDGELCRP